mmetsp:Transcript_48656/g.97881  ORF Transcript_48656/g.97881 Transcript_48656/m.97881 type:complete len:229 (+) Transcript_48656:896-1582(+)
MKAWVFTCFTRYARVWAAALASPVRAQHSKSPAQPSTPTGATAEGSSRERARSMANPSVASPPPRPHAPKAISTQVESGVFPARRWWLIRACERLQSPKARQAAKQMASPAGSSVTSKLLNSLDCKRDIVSRTTFLFVVLDRDTSKVSTSSLNSGETLDLFLAALDLALDTLPRLAVDLALGPAPLSDPGPVFCSRGLSLAAEVFLPAIAFSPPTCAKSRLFPILRST